MKKLTLMAVALLGLTFAACNNEPKNNQGSGDPASVTITISDAITYGFTGDEVDGTDAENKISSLELYVFNDPTTPDPLVGESGKPGYVKVAVDASKQFKQQLVVTEGTSKIFVAVVNMNVGNVASYAALQAKIDGAYASANPLKAEAGKFEMSGEKKGIAVAAGATTYLTVNVARLASRVDVPVTTNVVLDLGETEIDKLWGENSGVTNTSLSFAFDGFTIINGIDKSDVLFVGNSDGDDRKVNPSTGRFDWGLWSKTGKSTIKSEFGTNHHYTKNYVGQVNGDYFLDGSEGQKTVYFYENLPERVTVPTPEYPTIGSKAETVVSMMVRGTLSTSVAGLNPVTRYWRVNFCKDEDNYSLRNVAYSVSISRIYTAGHDNPEQAEKENPVIPDKKDATMDMTININKWRINTFSGEM